MSILFFSYIIIIGFTFILWFNFFKRYKNISSFYFFISCISISLWYIFYILSYFSSISKEILLYIYRIDYVISIIWIYSFILFFYYYNLTYKKPSLYFLLKNWFFIVILLLFYVCSPYIISDLKYNYSKLDYYEELSFLWNIHYILSFLWLLILFYVFFMKYRVLNVINKLRLKYIFFWGVIFIFLSFVFFLILPFFLVFEFEKFSILFILPFLYFSHISINKLFFKRAFISIKYYNIILSIIIAISIFYFFKFILLWFLNEKFYIYWQISNNILFTDIILIFILFFIINYLFFKTNILSYNNNYESSIFLLKSQISYLLDPIKLNKFLLKNSKIFFWSKFIRINYNSPTQIINFFKNNPLNNIFVNDIVFIQENIHKFDINTIKNFLDKDILIYFPIRSKSWNIIWIFEIWKKFLDDIYYEEEIKILINFTYFLSAHLKYISIYKNFNNLNINLLISVNQKILEYNTLFNKQKEFISIISHEIKNKVLNLVFELDIIFDTPDKFIKKEKLNLINKQSVNLFNLIEKLFSAQKYDIVEINLYRENINIKSFLDDIFFEYEGKYIINYKLEIFLDYFNIDQVQFRQLFDNLIQNSIKFSIGSIYILIKVYKSDWFIMIEYHDNWIWFDNTIDLNNIFDIYYYWNYSNTWMWIGLFFCKKILELHNGNIKASNSNILLWAMFYISFKY